MVNLENEISTRSKHRTHSTSATEHRGTLLGMQPHHRADLYICTCTHRFAITHSQPHRRYGSWFTPPSLCAQPMLRRQCNAPTCAIPANRHLSATTASGLALAAMHTRTEHRHVRSREAARARAPDASSQRNGTGAPCARLSRFGCGTGKA